MCSDTFVASKIVKKLVSKLINQRSICPEVFGYNSRKVLSQGGGESVVTVVDVFTDGNVVNFAELIETNQPSWIILTIFCEVENDLNNQKFA